MKKTTEKVSLVDQLKAMPKQVKMFIFGLVAVVAALAFVLPNMNSKFLQGSVLNVGGNSKISGYGYGYEPPYLFIDDNGYGYGYQVDENTKKYIRIRNVEFYFDNISDILTVKVKYSARYEGIMVVEPSFYVVEPSKINYGMSSPSYIGKCLVLENNDICTMEQQFFIDKTLHGSQIKVTPVFKTRVTAVSNYDQRALGQIIIDNNNTGNICQTPENVLACSLQLSSCPMQCRPAICQTPEVILACDLGLGCPTECMYGMDGTGVRDVAITDAKFYAASNREAKIYLEITNHGNIDMPIDVGVATLFINGNGTQYSIETLETPVKILKPKEVTNYSAIIRPKKVDFTNNSFLKISISTYPETDQNPNNNEVKVYLTGNINGLKDMELPVTRDDLVNVLSVEEAPQVTEVIEETKEPVDANNTLMDMLQSLVK